MNQKKIENLTSEVIYRCKVDSKRFFSEDELLSHLKERHSESYTVQRIVEHAEPEQKVEPTVKKRPYKRRQKIKIEAPVNSESANLGEGQTDAIKPQFAQP